MKRLRLLLACFLMLAAGQAAAYILNLNDNVHIGNDEGPRWSPEQAIGTKVSLSFPLANPATLQQISFFDLGDVEAGWPILGFIDGKPCPFCLAAPASVAIDGVAIGTLDRDDQKFTLVKTLSLSAGEHTLTVSAGRISLLLLGFGYDDIQWDKIQLDLGNGSGSLSSDPFNAVDRNTDPITGPIQTRIAGQPFDLDIYALKDGRVNNGFDGDVQIDLVDASSGAVCAELPTLPGWSSMSATLRKGEGTLSNILYADAVAKVRVRITQAGLGDGGGHGHKHDNDNDNDNDNGNGNGNGNGQNNAAACSSDNFAIRPSHFLIQASDQNWESPGTTNILNTATASGTPIHKAGQPFTLRASAVNASGTATSGYTGGTPTAIAVSQVLPAGGALGTLATASWTFSAGVTESTAAYSEVGAVAVQVTDSGFASVDASDGTPLCQRSIGLRCNAGNQPQYAKGATTIGRFVPDHFEIPAISIRNRTDAATLAGCGNPFSYLDEQFDLVFSISAHNAQNQLTRNYSGTLAKFDQPFAPDTSASQGRWRFSAIDSPVSTSSADLTPRLAQNGFAGSTAFSNGEADGVRAQLKIRRQDSAPGFTPDGPFLNTDISLTPEDGDGVMTKPHNPVHSAFYFGRLTADNAYGSELLPLPMWVRTQFWDSASRSWRDKTDDTCSLFQLSPPTGTALGATAANDGRGYWTQADYSATGGQLFAPNTSGHRAGAQLWYTAGGTGGSFLVPFAAHPYLLSQPALAAFGHFQGNRHIIYWREVLN
ncbi:DUF6701 domain-containing protein [Thermithiobacillus plumbiphilus]|uniref:DUF6701 domain-containing protein n=1 Tax=Thermithiobacillus plumbiphilus TaxID=1729899 RepID=A0ABU9D6S9_9PROT